MSQAARPDRLASLVAALRGAGCDPSWTELSDALWLAQYTRGGAAGGAGAGSGERARGVDGAREADAPADEPARPPDEAPDPARAPADRPAGAGRLPRPEDETVLLYADPGGLAGAADRPPGEALPVGVPEARALPGLLGMERALRPLRRYTPPTGPPRRSTRALVLDEPATAERTARAGGLLTPVFRAEPRGHTELQLLMDAAPAMRVWQRMLTELAEVFGRLGAFRDIQVHYLHRSPDGSPAVSRRFEPEGAALRPARQLRDPTGRRLTVVVSDCAGPLWREGAAHRLLHALARHAPVAVVQPLPQRLWPRTRLPASYGALVREAGPAGSVRLRFAAEGLAAGQPHDPAAVAVPLLPPTSAALGAWAGLLAGTGAGQVPAAVGWVRADQPPAARRRARPGGAPSAAAALARFRAAASPGAVRLAVYLAAAPLFLPVMQLIQRTMLPDSGPAELSEVLLSGLLRRLDGPAAEAAGDGLWFAFVDGVQDELLAELGHDEALLVLKHCSGYVSRRFGGAGPNFPALALAQLAGTEPAGPDPLTGAAEDAEQSLPRPFAEVAAKVLRRFLPAAPPPPRDAARSAAPSPSRVVARARTLAAAFAEDGQVRHLLAAVGLLRQATTEWLEPGQRTDPELWGELAEALLRLWRAQRDGELLVEARQAAETAAAHLGSPAGRRVLARVLHAAAGERRAAGDTRGALELWRLADREFAAVHTTPGLDREAALEVTLDRVEVLTAQWRLGGDTALLQECVGMVEAVADAWPADQPQPSGLWLAHGRTLLRLADAAPDLERARVHAGQAADSLRQGCWALESERAPARARVSALLDLADALLRTDDEWRRAAEVIETAGRLAEDPAARASCLSRAGRLALRAYEVDGEVVQLETAAARFEEAGRLASRDRPEYSALIEEWGAALLLRAQREDGAAFVSRAVRVLRDCRMETAEGDPRLPGRLLRLGQALTARYRDAGDLVDLREAEYLFHRAARRAEQPLTVARAYLELGETHRRAFGHTHRPERLDQAADAFRRAASAALAAETGAVDPREPVRLAATALHERGAVFETAGRPLAAGGAYRSALQQWRRLPDGEKAGAETAARLAALARER
ncbi:SAV_2336 N-terminal domain-related protein [Streptomyces sp. DSM 44915]|uniref:SAV_2336 N-terminal domain-related protein n=1 Tax=Streptomyces chisholmiae TaxID=3075540 RepID=A0ABU2JKY3_9ACTN|nr:SAV_2336 N-terminal domain-related protein [Streptomyces sp. DSM 44915]MDT0265645.1 SAV_2336 N-terminal domain-related protein [Streptomyces sp. DSM 44915]